MRNYTILCILFICVCIVLTACPSTDKNERSESKPTPTITPTEASALTPTPSPSVTVTQTVAPSPTAEVSQFDLLENDFKNLEGWTTQRPYSQSGFENATTSTQGLSLTARQMSYLLGCGKARILVRKDLTALANNTLLTMEAEIVLNELPTYGGNIFWIMRGGSTYGVIFTKEKIWTYQNNAMIAVPGGENPKTGAHTLRVVFEDKNITIYLDAKRLSFVPSAYTADYSTPAGVTIASSSENTTYPGCLNNTAWMEVKKFRLASKALHLQ